MTVDFEVLQFLANVAVLPALGYIILLERRLMRLETLLTVRLESLPCLKVHGACLNPGGLYHGNQETQGRQAGAQ